MKQEKDQWSGRKGSGTHPKKATKRTPKDEDNLRKLWDNIKQNTFTWEGDQKERKDGKWQKIYLKT